MSASFSIAEKTGGSRRSLALLRWSLVIIFLWFGGMKFTNYEANGIAPFIAHSPIVSWLHGVFGVQGASYVIGIIQLLTAVLLVAGALVPLASALGAGNVLSDLRRHFDVLAEHAGSGGTTGGRISGNLRADRAVFA